jgi:hypothetical protein
MGYDMYWVTKDPGSEYAYAAATAAFRAACQARDAHPRGSEPEQAAQAVVTKTYDLMDEFHADYFRLNIWGMGRYRKLMAELGMLSQPEMPSFPDAPDSMDWDAYETLRADGEDAMRQEHGDRLTVAFLDQVVAYYAESERIRGLEFPEEPGIPIHKFGSNDIWLVTPREIREALVIYEANPARDEILAPLDEPDEEGHTGRPYWDEWIAWLRGAIEHDGFTVH